MEGELDIQGDIIDSIRRIGRNYDKDSKTRHTSNAYFDNKIEAISDYWREFKIVHAQLLKGIVKSDRDTIPYFVNDLFDTTEDFYLELREKLCLAKEQFNDKKNALMNQPGGDHLSHNQNQVQNKHKKIKLPHIKLAEFSGEYSQWITFKNTFRSLIHSDNDLSATEKMHYLKSCITGPPNELINGYDICDENYEVVWEILQKRYDNIRKLVDAQLEIFLAQKALSSPTAEDIRSLMDTTIKCLNSLKTLNIEIENWDPIVVYLLVQKLDQKTLELWETAIKEPRKTPTFKEFSEFLEARFDTLSNIDSVNKKKTDNKNFITPYNKHHRNNNSSTKLSTVAQSSLKPSHTFHASNNTNISTTQCPVCNSSHSIFVCKQFLDSSIDGRKELVGKHKLCSNCLRNNHITNDCKARHGCKKCRNFHSTLLHVDESSNYVRQLESANTEPTTIQSASPQQAHHTISCSPSTSFANKLTINSQVLLATALVKVKSSRGTMHTLRALLDQGSESSFITESAMQLLNLSHRPVIAPITGLGTVNAGTSTKLVNIEIKSRINTTFSIELEALVLPNLTKHMPRSYVNHNSWKYLDALSLADPTFQTPGNIDLLLGADVYGHILLNGVIRGEDGSPVAQQTELGWILSGPFQDKSTSVHTISSLVGRIEVDDQLKKFWEIEELQNTRQLTKKEDLCEKYFSETHKRQPNGKYIVRLPFSSTPSEHLGFSRGQAVSRLLQMERKLSKNENLKQQYVKFMSEYLELGHMILTHNTPNSIQTNTYYLPHHAVIKDTSTSTKLRVVFDGSAKTSNKTSLNDLLLTGPTLQDDMATILMRWRKHKIAFSADIEKMYRQIIVHSDDAEYQRIVWRNEPTENIMDYKLTTVTYGTSSAPYLAIKTLRQLAHDEQHRYPKASAVALRDFYVDDVMTGADTVDEALELQKQLLQMLQGGGMVLRKWTSNHAHILETVPKADREVSLPLRIELDETIKALGIHWHPAADTFQFKVTLPELTQAPTKRNLLSEVARLFDPLGWLAPTIILAKIMFQRLWLEGLTWDESLPPNISIPWKAYRAQLSKLEKIRIPRWIETTKNTHDIQIHGFCDASQEAYAAVVYLSVTDNKQNTTITLLTSKTRVAPIKIISLPRLELCGAVLLANLIKRVRNSQVFESADTYAWTDSTIVLAWLKGHPSRWKTFVANRMTEIHNILNVNQWHHVKSEDNPADCASRGVPPQQLQNHHLWWGPDWLKSPEFIDNHKLTSTPETEFELKNDFIQPTKNLFITNNDQFDLLNRYSCMKKLTRITALCIRFIHNARSRLVQVDRILGSLTTTELEEAQARWIRLTQENVYFKEISQLKSQSAVSSKSKLFQLCPFIDDSSLLRIGGRIQNSTLTYDEIHPLILPPNHQFTSMLIHWAHIETKHGGTQQTLGILRRKFWIINGRNQVKMHIHRCTICHRFKASPNEQLMGNLPRPRLTITRPFTNVGCDFAGPIDIRVSKGRGNKSYKGYICVFICLSTKAIHLEAVSDLTTPAFIAAFKRFVARRGLCSNVYSDNGTNFVGAATKLERDRQNASITPEITDLLANDGVKWHFIPPASPHFGGIWEAGVKSTKHHLRRIIGKSTLTFEEMATILAQIEACLNSRPLCALTDDPSDLNPLTPGHFLIGAPLKSPPFENLSNANPNALTRWRLLEKLHQDFWQRWSKEYVTRLQQRPKWAKSQAPVKVGDLVLIIEDNRPPLYWPLGRITETHAGIDGVIRVATIRTASSVLKRSIAKISKLPITDNDNITEILNLNKQ